MICCHKQKLVYTDTDIVCSSCGVISPDDMVENNMSAPRSKVIPCDENRIGSADISPPSILHSRKHRNILKSRQNPYEKKLYDACSILSIPNTLCRRTLYLFKTIRHTRKISLGITAFFCIYQTCRENNIRVSDDAIITTVKECFALKREIRVKKAIFVAESVLIDASKKIHLAATKKNGLGEIKSDVLKKSAIRLSDKHNILNATDIIKQMGVDSS